jgi:hypothetical protein
MRAWDGISSDHSYQPSPREGGYNWMTIDVPSSGRLTLQLDAIRKKPTTTGDSAHSCDRVPFTVFLLSAESRTIHCPEMLRWIA